MRMEHSGHVHSFWPENPCQPHRHGVDTPMEATSTPYLSGPAQLTVESSQMIDHTPRAACRAMAARRRSVALLSLCRRCRPALNEPPCMYSITDETVPCRSTHRIRGLCADATCQQRRLPVYSRP